MDREIVNRGLVKGVLVEGQQCCAHGECSGNRNPGQCQYHWKVDIVAPLETHLVIDAPCGQGLGGRMDEHFDAQAKVLRTTQRELVLRYCGCCETCIVQGFVNVRREER